jgi:hypothetical protein
MTSTLLKKDCDPDVVRKVGRSEDRSDKCFRNIDLLKRPWNVAVWASLTESIRVVETAVPPSLYGSRHHINAATNMSRGAALLYRLARNHGRRETLNVDTFSWNARIAIEARQAIDVARQYDAFCTTFPYWHADMYAGEVVREHVVRFVSNATPLGKRIHAYQQGIRPTASQPDKPKTGLDMTPELLRLFRRSLDGAQQVSKHGVRFPHLRDLQAAMYEAQEERSSAMSRRYPNIRIGEYTLDDFRRFYSAINSTAGSHEFLTYQWSLDHGLPLDTLVLSDHRYHWVRHFSATTKLPEALIYAMLKDVTFGKVFAVDFHLRPFVPLNTAATLLALAPYVSLSSNWEENVLNCFARTDSDLYSMTSLTKEDEMRKPLIALTSGTRLIIGGCKLPRPVPDIDLIVDDLDARILIICEMKWIRKPNSRKQRQTRDEEVLKGFSQIEKIRRFVETEPEYLYRQKCVCRRLSEYSAIHFCVVARDHLVVPPANAAPLYSYEDFYRELKQRQNTQALINCLEGLEWLPVEGVDFTTPMERNTVNGVSVESEIYYPRGGPLAFA